VFVARQTARNVTQLAWQMARGDIKAASVAWATADELTSVLPARARLDGPIASTGRKAEGEPRHEIEASQRQKTARPPPAARPVESSEHSARHEEQAIPEILIPAYVDLSGRDSLGRRLDAGSVAAAIASDRTMQQEREALWNYLRGTYRDPYAAKAQLDEMVKRQGWTSTAVRIAKDPTQLGELRGKLVGARAKAERANALQVAEAIAPGLDRIRAAEARATQRYRASVEVQRKADATVIPKLAARAEAAVAALAAANDDQARAALWRRITADNALGTELQRFSTAVQQRFGEDAVRDMLRDGGHAVEAASVLHQHRAALAIVSRTVHVLREGEHAHASQAEAARLAQRHTLGYRQGLKP
jgi:hypothetical protein